MLKIVITDPHLMDSWSLVETGKYLMALGMKSIAQETSPAIEGCHPFVPPAPAVNKEINKSLNKDLKTDVYDDGSSTANLGDEPEQPFTYNPTEGYIQQADGTREEYAAMGTPPAPKEQFNPFAATKPSASVEVDIEGLPWDSRIHARTKTKVADGSWKLMRGIDSSIVELVKEQLRAAIGAPPAISVVPCAVFTPPPIVNVPVTPASEDPANPTMETFPMLMTKISKVVTAGKMTHAEVLKIVNEVGLPAVAVIGTRPDLIPLISSKIDSFVS